jgi:hypothetical protein
LRIPQAIGLPLSALVLIAVNLGTSRGEEPEYLRLRPLKEPAPCANNANGCPFVAAPRINERDSTIPGVAYPDFGRPRVFRLTPHTRRGASQYGALSGNRGIGGVPTAPSVALVSEADKLGEAVLSCWTPPEHVRGSVIMQMSFRRDGSLFGHPIPKHIDVSGDENARNIFVSAVVSAAERCAPLNLSPALAESIAGQPLLFQFDAP